MNVYPPQSIVWILHSISSIGCFVIWVMHDVGIGGQTNNSAGELAAEDTQQGVSIQKKMNGVP
jgi:hypothetical protein